ncbi:hypothetical protein NC651_037225 [Populus alba x Populus x berolinensis]|nr:hypothetical protein NC651_037225 [Populus alba x Populus x berolinensis]
MKWISWKLISLVHTPQQISVACRNHNQMKWISWKLIDLPGPQPIRLTESATTCSTIHQKTM